MNKKVPFAMLSCFFIAFILQGALKLSGVFVFEKVLDWQIFTLIDNSKILNTIFCTILMFITIYCLSFTFTTKFYSKKWYHYVFLFVSCAFIIILRLENTNIPFKTQILLDMFIYVVVPLVVNFTTPKEHKLFKFNMTGIVSTICLHIMLYFVYLGLTYWSGLLGNCVFIEPKYYLSSANFLIKFEVYIGLILFMISSNLLMNYIKRRDSNMMLPFDIASDEAKEKELQELEEKKKK
jgi:hypothetical protein